MKLKVEILKEHSKTQCTKIVNWVGNNQERFDELFDLFLQEEHRVAQIAGWPMSNCVIAHPALISKHWKKFLSNLEKQNLHNAVRRNSMRLMEEIEIPVKYHGAIMNTCFRFLKSPTEFLAVKVSAMSVLAELAKIYPEISQELKLMIEDQFPQQTAGFKSRAKKVLKQLEKL